MSDYYTLKEFADGPHMVVDPKGKWAWAKDLAAARAENERLTQALKISEAASATNMRLHQKAEAERDLSKKLLRSCIKGNTALREKAQKTIAERDEARAQVAAAFKAASDVLFDHGDGTVEIALDKRLCCNGYQCGCQGATVGLYLQHLIRSLTLADSSAALEAYGREKVREGLKRAIDLAMQPNDDHGVVSAEAREFLDAILVEMEKLK